MKKLPIKPILTIMSFSIVWAQVSPVSAHDVSGTLGTANTAIDYYQVHCYDDGSGPNDHLYVALKDLAPKAAPKVSIQVIRDDIAVNTTDAVDGDASYSPPVSVKGSDGFFYMTIDKTATGMENYSVQFHCVTSDNQHTGTDIFQLTDQ